MRAGRITLGLATLMALAPAHGEESLEARQKRVASASDASATALRRGDCATAARALRTALDVPGPELEFERTATLPLVAATVQCYLNAGQRQEGCALADELNTLRAQRGEGVSPVLIPHVEGFHQVCSAPPAEGRSSTWPWVGVAGGGVLVAGGVTLALGALVDSPPTATDAEARSTNVLERRGYLSGGADHLQAAGLTLVGLGLTAGAVAAVLWWWED